MKKALKAIGKTVKLIFIVFCVFVGTLFFRQQRLPRDWVEAICCRLSTDRIIITCDSVSVGFIDGFHFGNLRAYDRERRDNLKPMFSSDSVSVFMFPWKIRIVGAKFPRLHDGYYFPDPEDSPFVPDRNSDFDIAKLELPRMPSFTLELIRPEILGIAPEKVTARVSLGLQKVDVQSIRLDWPDQDRRMWLDGYCTMDFASRLVIGEVSGTARQEHIRPLLVALDLPGSYEYMGGYPDTGTSGFTEVIGPVPASCFWKVDLATSEFNLELDLHPVMGRYNNVRLQRADGKVGVHVYFTDEYMGYDITVGPLTAVDLKGRLFGGCLTVHSTNDVNCLEFDAHSELEKQDTLDIMGYLNKGTLDVLKCDTPVRVTAKGVFNCNDANIPNNDFGGHVECDKGAFVGEEFNDLKLDYHLRGSEITFTNVTAKGVVGGDACGYAVFHVPIAEGDEDFYGYGSVCIENGKLVQVPLFSVLTAALAENVPGIEKLVNQSEACCDFTISNGVFRTENLVVEGALFSIRLSGFCDLTTEEIDFVAHCTVMKKESVLGKYLIQPVLWPFTKFLTEFEVTGKARDPKLRNTSVKGFTDKAGELTTKAGNFIKDMIIR